MFVVLMCKFPGWWQHLFWERSFNGTGAASFICTGVFLSLFSENYQEKVLRMHRNTLVVFQIRTTCESKLCDGKICLILFFNDEYVKNRKRFSVCFFETQLNYEQN